MLVNDQNITLAGGFTEAQRVVVVDTDGAREVGALFSTQEEADTRMLYHAINLTPSNTRLIIRCDDTNVLVLLLYYHSKGLLSDLVYMHTGHHANRERFIPVHTICENIGTYVALALPATQCPCTDGV